ncbi:MAG: hypothetical protein QM501_05715, partial [Gimesia sp.]
MAWPEVSIEDLPPERDDEPVSLRQDILDELSDHFVCALNRELLKNPDEQTAKQRVINQFGNPVKIARQLWFDAMKEKIMSQRIMTGVSIIMAVCCIAVVGIAWSLMDQSQAVNQKLMAQLAAIADRPEPVSAGKMDQEILKQLNELKQGQRDQAPPVSVAMNEISFQLVEEGDIEKPPVGFSGKLSKTGGKTDSFSLSVVADSTGKLDFGKLPWGNYSLSLHSQWNEDARISYFTTIPGRDYSQTIVCPTAPPEDVPVEFQVNMQKNSEEEWQYLLCDFRIHDYAYDPKRFRLQSSRMIQNHNWTFSHDLKKQPEQGVYLIDIKNNQVIPCPVTVEGKYKNLDLKDIVWQKSASAL